MAHANVHAFVGLEMCKMLDKMYQLRKNSVYYTFYTSTGRE